MRRWLCYGILILSMGWWRGCDTLAPPTVVYFPPSRTPSAAVLPVATPTLTAEVFLERGDNLARRGDYRVGRSRNMTRPSRAIPNMHRPTMAGGTPICNWATLPAL